MVMQDNTGWEDKNPEFELGEPLFIRPETFDETIDATIFIPVGFRKGMFTGWIAECKNADDMQGESYTIPCSFLTRKDPWKRFSRVIGNGITKKGNTLLCLSGGRY